ncbi:MAG: L-2-amino-thiazoline-4-carboxylic acid hydrolase [Pseudomonadota bacterium]
MINGINKKRLINTFFNMVRIDSESGNEEKFMLFIKELYEKLGYLKYGKIFSCNRDFAFFKGFNSKIKCTHTKTIMGGDDICDFKLDKK